MAILNNLKDLYRSLHGGPFPLEKPFVIQFPVNDICNARCQMCNVWQQKLDFQMAPADLKKALANPLFSKVRAVGINGGEPTLRIDLPELVDVLYRALPKLKTISLITNALDHRKVIPQIESINRIISEHGGSLDIMVSLDGVGEVHDKIRGRSGSFENAEKVIDYIKKTPNLPECKLGCTVVKDNVFGLHDLLDFAIEKEVYIKYRLGIPHKRLYVDNLKDPFVLSFEQKYHFCVFLENLILHYERSETQKFFYRSLIDQIMHGKPRQAGCDWAHRGVTLSSRGELLYCAVASDVLGSAIKEDSEKLYFGSQTHLTNIVKNQCAHCCHDYVGLPPAKVLLKQYLAIARGKLDYFPDKWLLQKLAPVKKALKSSSFVRRLNKFRVVARENTYAEMPEEGGVLDKSALRVMICGWYGTETLGDKAILGGVVHSIREAVDRNVSFYLVSLEPYISKMTVTQMPELAGAKVLSVEEGLAQVKNMELVAFGGGPLMAISNLAEMQVIFEQAGKHRVPTIIAGCGVGPLGARYYNGAIKELLELASSRIYRDIRSRDLAKSLGVDSAKDFVAEDPAFTWLENQLSLEEGAENESGNGDLELILGLRDWPYNQYAPWLSREEGEAVKRRFERHLLTALQELLSMYRKLKIVPYPMCTNHYGGDDRWYYRQLFREVPELRQSVDFSVLSAEEAPNKAFQRFRNAGVALTMRFHSLVFALGSQTPPVAIDYTLGRGKVASLADLHGIPCRAIDSLDSEFIVSSIDAIIRRSSDEEKKAASLSFPQSMQSALRRLMN